MTASSDIADAFNLKASLEWGATLDLTEDQRKSLDGLCCKVSTCVPSWRLKEAQDAKRAAEQRVKELESRGWWPWGTKLGTNPS